MSDSHKNYATLSLKVMINKEKNKVLFAEADNHFVDILLSFLTLPLGRIIKVFDLVKQFGKEADSIGSISSLYNSLANLDSSHFVTKYAKQTLLNPASSFKAEYEKLKLDITGIPPAKSFYCIKCKKSKNIGGSLSFDEITSCDVCLSKYLMSKGVDRKGSQSVSSDGVFTTNKDSFIISDDLQILPNETGLVGIISILGITDADKAEAIKVSVGFDEIVKLLKASLTSPTPLSDVILKKTKQTISSSIVESEPIIVKEENDPNSNLTLKVIVQKSTGKLLYAESKEEFIHFLCSFSFIPLGRVVHLLAGNTSFKAINNLYRSTTDLIADEYFKSPDTKKRLMKPNVPHGCISKNYILPLTQEALLEWPFTDVDFPNGYGSYLRGSRTYQVKDDLTVVPFCFVSIISGLKEQKTPVSDVKEVEVQIGLKEALSILKASLSSTSALTDALSNHVSIKQPKRTSALSDYQISNKQPRRSL